MARAAGRVNFALGRGAEETERSPVLTGFCRSQSVKSNGSHRNIPPVLGFMVPLVIKAASACY